jgi:hypothetical protein
MLKGLRKISSEGGICLSMLPGFRFLFAATLFSMSILVFGLGAAALLRAAHEQFASNPSWHAAPGATFAQQVEASKPMLAMLRVEPPATEQKASDSGPAINPAAIAAPAEPDGSAALAQDAAAPQAAATPDMPAAENPASIQAAEAPGDPTMADSTKLAASAGEAKVASTEQAAPEPVSQPANEASPAARETDAAASSQASVPAAPEADIAATKIATLDPPSATVEPKPPARTVIAKPDQGAIKKRLRAQRAAQRRRMAARAARHALLAQQSANPFVQSFPQPAATAIRSR